ncbi:ParA family protein [Deinococcus ruber]|uniref:Chromosome partitioning protein ParA n=1 Tax=Deinococcus ruber TaxID=1848197 RepID=A0A918C3Y5_9DEIO|nr:AAA family ATPase [Deinococcus ruber]GGR04576.1 chromosome partitioning protein ParA [Deinococcus ruber]
MTHVVSFINLKGGVAKTTTLVQLAETLAFIRGKRVLVIDLDPQTNATIALIGETRWERVDEAGQTLAQLFLDKIHGTQVFELERAILHGVSNLNLIHIPDDVTLGPDVRYPRIDLLPSSIRLIEAQDRMNDIALRSHHTISPMDVIRQAVSGVFGRYDYVLIDCPPNLGYITQNGLEVSDFYLIPTIPDRLSTHGIPQIVKTISELRRMRRLSIRCLGALVTKYQVASSIHKRGLETLPDLLWRAFEQSGEPVAPLFDVRIPQANATAEAMDWTNSPANFKEKYGRSRSGSQQMFELPILLADEFMARLEAATALTS